MDYPASVEFLYSLGNEIKTLKFGLDRIREMLSYLGHPEQSFRSIHIAGTNGKGSTCAMIEAGIRAAGRKTGLYTSPHLLQPVERIRIDWQPVPREEFAEAFRIVHAAAQELLRDGRIDFHPTYFETVTAMAFGVFARRQVEFAVIETGLGGRLDATNALRPELCVITPIDLDHQNYLGDTIGLIAGEKAGILKPGVPAVIARQHAEARQVLEASPAPLIHTADLPVEDIEVTAEGSSFLFRGRQVCCPLAGEHQVENALAACAALDHLGFDPAGIRDTVWPARLERIGRRLIDGAHNPAGARALARHLARFYADREITLLFGAMRDKAVGELLDILLPCARRWIFTEARTPRAMPAVEIARMAGRGEAIPEIAQALEATADADLTVISGSLFVAGEARGLLLQ